MAEPGPVLPAVGASVLVGEHERQISRRAGSDWDPILRLAGCEDRDGARALCGAELLVARAHVPELGPDEWWAEDLEGCTIVDGRRHVGTVRRLLGLPSCEVLEVIRGDGRGDLLVPLVIDAVRRVDVQRREIEIDLGFLGEP